MTAISATSARRRDWLMRRGAELGAGGIGRLLVALALGTAAGLLLTHWVVSNGLQFGKIAAGPWTSVPQLGSYDVNPYSRAVLVRHGELPLALGEGMVFSARVDSTGAPLEGRCRYLLRGPVPQARLWTLTAYTPQGGLIANPVGRYGVNAHAVLRDADGLAQVRISRYAEPGNWLPIGASGAFVLQLNLYDTPISAVGVAIDPAILPRIERLECP